MEALGGEVAAKHFVLNVTESGLINELPR